ncbi:NADH dehydrogenase [ubiquinone] 1 beta subcomplex subunit 9 [Oncorhynchus tshawytscha]|uniref:NADH dehydrogenase [ubiquinone] 1 beta subcomplex subunit 9 n=1 Tax=Oncorhynchus tshawytscha TaxID=74940 RepID=UPI000D0A596D|nr:NADH dehydrogenase [ubiquinone] 1 beta subcomplex subunit 9 [Oncorhynchus tshawytscha]
MSLLANVPMTLPTSVNWDFCWRSSVCDLHTVPEWCLDHWHPPDGHVSYFAKREQWKNLQEQSWDKEVQELQGVTPAIGPKSEALPPVCKNCDLPPLWWQYAIRPRERPVFQPPDDTTW